MDVMSQDEYQPFGYCEKDYQDIMKFVMMPHHSDFIFRGEGDYQYNLVPYAHRINKKADGGPSGRDIVEAEARVHKETEAILSGPRGEDGCGIL